jgi:hypothetical protein
MIAITDVLNRMMRVPKRGAATVGFDIDTFLRKDNAELIRAKTAVLAKLPVEAHPYLAYFSTNYHKARWRHTFMLHNLHRFPGVKRRYHHVPCVIDERRLPMIHIHANYWDAVHNQRYTQAAYLCRRTGSVEICHVVTGVKDDSAEFGVHLYVPDERERLAE